MHQGVRAEKVSDGGGGDEGEYDKGLTGLQQANINSDIIQMLGADQDSFRRQLTGVFG